MVYCCDGGDDDDEQDLCSLTETNRCVSGMERNFKKRQGQTFNLGYDIGSIMHYGR